MVVCWQENVVNCQWDNNKHQFMVLHMEFCTYQEEHRNFFFVFIKTTPDLIKFFFLCLKVTHLQLNPHSLDLGVHVWTLLCSTSGKTPLGRWGITEEELWCFARVLHSFSTLHIPNFLDTNPKISWIKPRNKISVNMLLWRNKHWFGRQ